MTPRGIEPNRTPTDRRAAVVSHPGGLYVRTSQEVLPMIELLLYQLADGAGQRRREVSNTCHDEQATAGSA
jgi:hypothetical protein